VVREGADINSVLTGSGVGCVFSGAGAEAGI
jgi:hypothetical protein